MNYLRLSHDELNEDALRRLVCQPVSMEMISCVASFASTVVQYDSQAPSLLESSNFADYYLPPFMPTATSGRLFYGQTYIQTPLLPLEKFIITIVEASKTQVVTLMGALVYLERVKSRLKPKAQGLRSTNHRIFLASIIIAAKYLNDISPMNKHWAAFSVIQSGRHVFRLSLTEINLMEMQLLDLLEWDLNITRSDLCAVSEPFLAPIRTRQAWESLSSLTYRGMSPQLPCCKVEGWQYNPVLISAHKTVIDELIPRNRILIRGHNHNALEEEWEELHQELNNIRGEWAQ